MKARSAISRLENFQRTVQIRRRTFDVPGVAVGVVAEGETIFADGFGTRRLGTKQPVTADTLFAICSCSKAFTTMLLEMLVEDGVLDWDQPVQEMLPEFEMFDRVVGARLTVRDLVTHRCGLPRHDYVWYGSSAKRPQLVQALRHLEPTADLRTTYQYQNLMYMTAGYLAGQLTDSSWEDLLRKRILEPLGMSATSTSVAELKSCAVGARPHESRTGKVREVPYRSLDAVAPAGAINSSVNDMVRWMRLHLGGGRFEGKRLISSKSLRDMYRPHMSMGQDENAEIQLLSYGLGWTVMSYRGHRVITHSGGIDGFRCRTTMLPDEGAGTVVLSNSDTALPHTLTWEILDTLLCLKSVAWSRRAKSESRREQVAQREARRRQLAGRTSGTKPSHRLDAYKGTYHHPGYGELEVRYEKRKLVARLNDLDGRLKHFHYDTFEFHGRRWPTPLLLSFTTGADGGIPQLALPLQEGVADIVFTRVVTEG